MKTNALTTSLAIAALFVGAACSAERRPIAEVAKAEQAILHAQDSSEAPQYDEADLRLAQDKLSRARVAMDEGDYRYARQLAEEALADAQLAEARANSEFARAQAHRTRVDIEAVRDEAATQTVVVEKPASASVVVERHTEPAVAIESAVVAAPVRETVIEPARPPVHDVVIESARPPVHEIVEPASPPVQHEVVVEHVNPPTTVVTVPAN
jgi:uncharacterized protein DUF4398